MNYKLKLQLFRRELYVRSDHIVCRSNVHRQANVLIKTDRYANTILIVNAILIKIYFYLFLSSNIEHRTLISEQEINSFSCTIA